MQDMRTARLYPRPGPSTVDQLWRTQAILRADENAIVDLAGKLVCDPDLNLSAAAATAALAGKRVESVEEVVAVLQEAGARIRLSPVGRHRIKMKVFRRREVELLRGLVAAAAKEVVDRGGVDVPRFELERERLDRIGATLDRHDNGPECVEDAGLGILENKAPTVTNEAGSERAVDSWIGERKQAEMGAADERKHHIATLEALFAEVDLEKDDRRALAKVLKQLRRLDAVASWSSPGSDRSTVAVLHGVEDALQPAGRLSRSLIYVYAARIMELAGLVAVRQRGNMAQRDWEDVRRSRVARAVKRFEQAASRRRTQR